MIPNQPGEGVELLLRRALAAGLAPGFVALSARDGGRGRVWHTGREALNGEAVTPTTLYDLASLTKPLATVTLLLLARREGLDLAAPLGEFLPELRGSPWNGVTLAQCAIHTAGFPSWAPLYAGGSGGTQGYLEALARTDPLWAPGARVEYSCLGFLALGWVLERGYTTTMGPLFAELVADPLGIAEELLYGPPETAAVASGERSWFVERAMLASRGFEASPPEGAPGMIPCGDGNARGLGGEAGNSGLFGTAAGISTVAAEFLPGGGRLLTATEADMATRCWTEGLNQSRGLGWQGASSPGCSAGPALSPSAFGHTGFTGTSVWVDGARRMILVLLGNRLHPGGRLADLHPLRRRFHSLAMESRRGSAPGVATS